MGKLQMLLGGINLGLAIDAMIAGTDWVFGVSVGVVLIVFGLINKS